MTGLKARTKYPPRPGEWPADAEWKSDTVFSLIKAGLLGGKSVGFVRLRSHAPTPDEIRKNPDLANANRIIDEWLLIEYAVTPLPVNQACMVETVSKSGIAPDRIKALGIELPDPPPNPDSPPALMVVFTPESEIHAAIERRIKAFDFEALARKAIEDGMDRARGRV